MLTLELAVGTIPITDFDKKMMVDDRLYNHLFPGILPSLSLARKAKANRGGQREKAFNNFFGKVNCAGYIIPKLQANRFIVVNHLDRR